MTTEQNLFCAACLLGAMGGFAMFVGAVKLASWRMAAVGLWTFALCMLIMLGALVFVVNGASTGP